MNWNIVAKQFIRVTLLVAALSVVADTETVDGIEWTYTVVSGKAKIYKGEWSAAIRTSTTGAITIPSSLGDCPVANIGDYAFYSCSGLTSVTIPSSVTGIGDSAFYNCSGLTSVTLPDSVVSIGDSAFKDCSGLADTNGFVIIRNVLYSYHGSDDAVVIPDGVTRIGNSAFYYCRNLTSLTIPNSVTTIGERAFAYCTGLTSLSVPDSVTSIGPYMFDCCSGLTHRIFCLLWV